MTVVSCATSNRLASRFEVAHDTTVTYASGRTSRIVSMNRLTRVGDCEPGTRKTPP